MNSQDHSVIENVLSLIGHLRGRPSPERLREAGEAARMNGQELRAVLEYIDFMEKMPGGFLIYRAEGDEEILFANSGLLRIFQCETMEEFRGWTNNSFRGLVAPEDLEPVEESIWQQIASSQFDLDYVEYRIIRRDGAIRWVEDYGHFIHSEAVGDVFYVFLADATEKHQRRQSEKERLLLEMASSEKKWRDIVDEYDKERSQINREYLRRLEVIEGLSINYESIFYVDLDAGSIQPYRLNRRTEAIFESLQNTIGYAPCMETYIRACVHEEDRERVREETSLDHIRRRLADGRTYYLNYRVLEEGEVEYLQVRFVNVGREGRASQVIIGCRRMDEELRLELEQKKLLEEALSNANSAITAKNTFLSNMSHDMRTPLNAIFGFTALAKNNVHKPEAVAGYLDRIEASSRQLLDMIDKVLKLSWTDSNEAAAEEAPCSLREILEETFQFLQPQAEEKGLEFTMDCSQVVHDGVLGDREKLGQLVMYLVNNAVTYTQSGGSVSLAAVEREPLPNRCAVYQIIVRDTGIGISEEFLEQIFEPFTRERNTTLSGIHGVGLGLTIAKNIVELLGGGIEVQSAVGEGSAFTVTLRLRLQNRGEEAAGAPRGPCRRILLAEDNPLNLEIETEILEESGFTVDAAADGEAAVAKYLAAPPGTYDLILTDIQMPAMNGWEAAEAIRALPDPERSRIPIIALSANVFESDIQKSRDSGINAHLPKPLDAAQLLRTIREIFGERN